MDAESFVPVVWQTSDGRYVVRMVEPTRYRAFRLPLDEDNRKVRAAQSSLYETFAAAAGWCARDAEEQSE